MAPTSKIFSRDPLRAKQSRVRGPYRTVRYSKGEIMPVCTRSRTQRGANTKDPIRRASAMLQAHQMEMLNPSA